MTAVVMNTADSLSQLPQLQKNTADNGRDKVDFSNLMRERLGTGQSAMANNTSDVTTAEPVESTRKLVDRNVKKQNDMTRNKAENLRQKPDEKDEINEEAAAITVLSNVYERVAERLGISTEDLGEAMEALSMSPMDLLDRNSAAQLILYLNGSEDMTDMLVDNGMLEALNDITSMTAAMVEESGVEDSTFAKLLTEGISNTEEAPAELKEAVAEADEHFKALLNRNTDNGEKTDSVTEPDTVDVTTVEKNQAPRNTENEGDDNRDGAEAETEDTEKTSDSERRDDSRTIIMSKEDFVSGLEQAADTGETSELQQADFREIVNQVVERIKVNLSSDSTSMEMRLNPENLGRVAINIVSKNGLMRAEIHTENEAAKEAIESQLQVLKENIQQKGIRVDEIEVNISDFHFADSKNSESEANNGEGSNSSRGKRSSLSMAGDSGEISEAAQNAREILENTGSTVSYRV